MTSRLSSVRGISLMEMMIAVVIIGIMAAMAAPSFEGAIKQMKFKGAGREILSRFRLARAAAVTLQEPHGIYIDSDTRELVFFVDKANLSQQQFDLSGDSVVQRDSIAAPIESIYSCFPNQTVVFFPDGTASSSGDVYIHYWEEEQYYAFSVWVTAATGRAKLEVYDYY
ncbi:MAG: prepilin-type N-terminal cleavage/methylation domain-containing protein [candidate division Zixibacteria bacterium]|nr:prepilin-type N-terminal cleavage/methylation domain-containing protein [candidate division Zixibacteria bacterium]